MSADEHRARARDGLDKVAAIAHAAPNSMGAADMHLLAASMNPSLMSALIHAVLAVSEEMHITNLGMGYDE